ncbi:MAG: PhzF family phenazine biosynthesis protein [Acidimicrobiales bacterium]
MQRGYRQVDVFAEAPQSGNPLAVVIDSEGLSTEEMQRFARWTNLSETTFLLPPTEPDADYRVRIFTQFGELPFAGHPTLGTCQVWLDSGGQPKVDGFVTQQCTAGLIPIAADGERLSFKAPPRTRSGPLDEATLAAALAATGLDPSAIVDSAWIDNGPGWLGLLLSSSAEVLAVTPQSSDLKIGLIGPSPSEDEAAFELRAFFPKDGMTVEDPVTGSLNASTAQWLLETGRATAPYLAKQGTALDRAGRVYVTTDDNGEVWVGGAVLTVIAGTVEL